MQKFCHSIQPELSLSSACLSTFRQAVEYCADVVMHTKPSISLWSRMDSVSSAQSNILGLSARDCHSLFDDIVDDYLLHEPRYAPEATTKAMLWQIVFCVMGTMALCSLLLVKSIGYRKLARMLYRHVPVVIEGDLFTPEQRQRACIKRNMRIVQHELRRLHVEHVAQPEDLFLSDGTPALVLRLSTKLSYLDHIATCQERAIGRLYRRRELIGNNNSKKEDFKLENKTNAVSFLNNYSRKLHVILVFEDEPLDAQQEPKRKKCGSLLHIAPKELTPPSLLLPLGQQVPNPINTSKSTSDTSDLMTPFKPRISSNSARVKTRIPQAFSRNSTIDLK